MSTSPARIGEVLVEPEGLDWEDAAPGGSNSSQQEPDADPLLELFRTGNTLDKKELLLELEKHCLGRSIEPAPKVNSTPLNVPQRREPRTAVTRPVEVWREGHEASHPQTTSLIDVSHGGARVGGLVFHLKGRRIRHLVSDGVDAKFQVIWVGETGTPQEGQIGLQSASLDI